MYAWGSARFCGVREENSWFCLVTTFPETLKNFHSEKTVAILSLSDEDVTHADSKMGLLLQIVQCNLDVWSCKTQERFSHDTFNFYKIRRIPFNLMSKYHKYHYHSKHTLPFYFCEFRRGKSIPKYGKGIADSQPVIKLWHVTCLHKESFQISVMSCSWLLSPGNWPVKLRQKGRILLILQHSGVRKIYILYVHHIFYMFLWFILFYFKF